MDRLFHGASHEGPGPSYTHQTQHSTQTQTQPVPVPVQSQNAASYNSRPALPSESEMPDEWGYPPSGTSQVSNAPWPVQGVDHQTGATPRGAGAPQSLPPAAQTVPICRYPNCRYPVTWDTRTYEYTEYCGLEHMRDAVQHHGVAVCSACGKFPRRTNSKFCGSSCETWAVQREQQMQSQQEPRPQQEHQQWHQQRQYWQPSVMGSPSIVPSAGAITWSNAARESAPPEGGGSWRSRQGLYQQ